MADLTKKAYQKTQFSNAQLLEFSKCANDPFYFLNNYFKIQHPTKGSMTYDAQNPWQTNSEVYDPRGAGTGAQGQQGEGNSWWLRMAKDDYFSFDYYRPAATGYIDGGGQLFGVSVFKVGSP